MHKNTRNKVNKNNRVEQLYNAAFKLFLLHQYKGVTIADLEKEADMTRGAIFYHIESKLDLYRKVIKKYWIDRQNLTKKMDLKNSCGSLKEFIINYTASIAKTMNGLHSLLGGCTVQQASQAYLSFLMQLRETAPDLNDEYLNNRNQELLIWNDMLREGVIRGEISPDIDTFAFAHAFLYIFYGQTFWEALDNGLNVDLLRRTYLKIYDSIRMKTYEEVQ